ncbi:hypothetical protein GH714_026409 [Hevea brasiliensis]|uniref:Uncharacterized protein n=1 Tax=Hevea brasiliensis TaxID=3981 RepID=A0A6A6N904_HEVBR|nr:hypothetical protein GH714_026409 [Hevea brasiliensis]
MAATLFHGRSDSLPSRPHPLMSQLDDHICRLRASEATASSTSISHKLDVLQDLHECVDKLLLLPLTQQGLAQENNRKCVDELLDGSLRLLDVCNSAKDALLQTKEYGLELQSTIRRRQGGEMVLQLREVQAITLCVLKSFLTFISGPKAQSKPSHWSLVSKLVLHKRIASEEGETQENEFVMADAALEFLVGCKTECNMIITCLWIMLKAILRIWRCAFKILKKELRASSGV